jgi:hypothetical protein
MTFEAPWAFGLLLAIPAILVLWVLRPRRPRVRVPSLLLWPASPAQRQAARPWQRLRQHPLLWLQVLAAALLALAAARPFVPAGSAGRHLVVLLDASGSMRAQGDAPGAPDRFGAARAAVLDLARALGPGQEMTVIRLDEQPRVLVAGARGPAEVEAALAGQAPSFGPADGAAALALAAGLTRGAAEWVLVSDGGVAFGEAARRPPGVAFRALAVASRPAANVAVTGLALREDSGRLALQAGLRNTGPARAAGRLQLLAEGQVVGAREWQLEPGAETYLTWEDLPALTGGTGGAAAPRWYEARLAGVDPAGNALEHDDRAWAAPAAPDRPAALLVSPGNAFLERALGVHGQVRAFRAAPADWAGLAAAGTPYPLTVLDRFWPEPLPAGSVLLVGPPAGEEFRPQQVYPRGDHPLLRHVDWSEVRVAAARRLPADGGWEPVIDSDGGPLLAVRTAGRSRQAVLTFELSQSDLPLRPAFPVLMANLLDWLLPRPDTAPRAAPPGGAVAVEPAPLAQQIWVEPVVADDRRPTTDDRYVVRGRSSVVGGAGPGDGRVDLAPPWPPAPFRPPAPGLYRVVQAVEAVQEGGAGAAGRQEFLVVADGYHPLEADLTPRTVDLPAADGAPAGQARGAAAFWPWLAAAVLALSTLEWWVDARGR